MRITDRKPTYRDRRAPSFLRLSVVGLRAKGTWSGYGYYAPFCRMLAYMLRSFLAGVLFLVVMSAAGQQQQDGGLSSYSHQQLVACIDKPELCHQKSSISVEDELSKRLSGMSTADLVHCFSDWKICGAGEWDVEAELEKRHETDSLIHKYGFDSDPLVRGGIELVAYRSKSTTAASYLRRVFQEKLDDGDHLYWPAMYLGKSCDQHALAYLNPGIHSKSIADNFSVSSLMFSDTVALFGKCHYRPAIPYMAQIGMFAASLNLVDAADTSLRKLYPGAPKRFSSLDLQQKYWCNRVKQSGFEIHCPED